MYTVKNFRSKKELKEAVIAHQTLLHALMYVNCPDTQKTAGEIHAIAILEAQLVRTRGVRYYQPGPFGGNEPLNGTFCCEGPHYPEPHRWYATCTAKDGVIVKVK
jgi:hypothetical protein